MAAKTTSKSTKKTARSGLAGDSSSLTDMATNELRDRILDLTLSPSERLDEKMLLKRFAFGRTPIREALNRLIAEGLVEAKNNRGAYVAAMSLEQTLELLEAYVLSERVLASIVSFEDGSLAEDLRDIQRHYEEVAENYDLLKITELNSKFHRRIAKATGNKYIRQQSADLHNLARRLSYFVYLKEKTATNEFHNQLKRINKQHHQIIDMIQSGDRSGLVDVMTNHAMLFRKRLSAVIDGFDKPDVELSSVLN